MKVFVMRLDYKGDGDLGMMIIVMVVRDENIGVDEA